MRGSAKCSELPDRDRRQLLRANQERAQPLGAALGAHPPVPEAKLGTPTKPSSDARVPPLIEPGSDAPVK